MPSILETASTFGSADLHFRPFLRLLEDSAHQFTCHTGTKHFYPRITVDEHALVYELYADLPGAQASDVTVEAHETHAIRISGTTYRLPKQSYNSETLVARDPSVQVHHSDAEAQSGAKLDPMREQKIPLHRVEKHHEDYVAQQDTDKSKQNGATLDGKPIDTTVTEDFARSHPTKKEAPINRHFIQERHYGEFHRLFRFPSAIEPNNVIARLENGVLYITIPKDMSTPPMKVRIYAPPPYGTYVF